MSNVLQPWLADISMMQQTVLITAVRGPDGITKYHPVKFLLRWYRRCVLYGALNHNIFETPYQKGGGSFTGPSYDIEVLPADLVSTPWQDQMDQLVSEYLKCTDEMPHHFHLHLMHAIEILGYKHPDHAIRAWWRKVYLRFVDDMHLNPEDEETLDYRLGDNETQWRAKSDPATQL